MCINHDVLIDNLSNSTAINSLVGTGSAKAGGNYAPCFKYQLAAKEAGYTDIIYFDACTGTKLEEVVCTGTKLYFDRSARGRHLLRSVCARTDVLVHHDASKHYFEVRACEKKCVNFFVDGGRQTLRNCCVRFHHRPHHDRTVPPRPYGSTSTAPPRSYELKVCVRPTFRNCRIPLPLLTIRAAHETMFLFRLGAGTSFRVLLHELLEEGHGFDTCAPARGDHLRLH